MDNKLTVKNSSYWTEEDVRNAIQDRRPKDNPMSRDLDFSKEDISLAMRFMATEVANVPPMAVGNIHPDRIPFQKFFLDGIIANLYDMLVERLLRNEYAVEGGGVGVDIIQVKRKNLQESAARHRQSFLAGVAAYKLTLNLNNAWGSF